MNPSEEPWEVWLRRHETWHEETNEWAQLTGALVDIAVRDGRDKTATASLNTLLDLLSVLPLALCFDFSVYLNPLRSLNLRAQHLLCALLRSPQPSPSLSPQSSSTPLISPFLALLYFLSTSLVFVFSSHWTSAALSHSHRAHLLHQIVLSPDYHVAPQSYGEAFSQETWSAIQNRALSSLFELPPARSTSLCPPILPLPSWPLLSFQLPPSLLFHSSPA